VVFPAIILGRYHRASKVFLQRDDGKSNLQWLYNIGSLTWWTAQVKAFRSWMRSKGSTRTEDAGNELVQGTRDDTVTTLLGKQPQVSTVDGGLTAQTEQGGCSHNSFESLHLPEDTFLPL